MELPIWNIKHIKLYIGLEILEVIPLRLLAHSSEKIVCCNFNFKSHLSSFLELIDYLYYFLF